MTQGITGTYSINGVDIQLSPSQGGWEDKDSAGIDGNGHTIFPQVTEFTMEWGLMATYELKQLQDAFLTTNVTGTAVVDLPQWGATDYTFYSYSGTIVSRPHVGKYFANYVKDVSLKVTNIRVS